MKKINYLFIFLLTGMFFLNSCSVMQQTSYGPKVNAPKFTTIDKILKLNVGMSYEEVVSTLGSVPYDVYTINYDTQKTVYIWYYKKIERKENPDIIETKEGSVSGEEVICCQELIYCTFDASKKLEKVITDAGKGTKIEKIVNSQQNQPQPQDQKSAKSIFKLL